MNCPKCGKELALNTKFCTGCGAKTGAASTAVAPRPAQMQPAAPTADRPPLPAAIAQPPPLEGEIPAPEKRPRDYGSAFRFGTTAETFATSFSNWKFHPAMGLILIVVVAAGYLGARNVALGLHGDPVTGPYTGPGKAFTADFPDGWRIVRNPSWRTGYVNTLAYFFMGKERKPDLFLKIFYTDADERMPKHFNTAQLEYFEPYILQMMTEIKQMEGAQYELLQLSTFMINGRDALWVDGNELREKQPAKRDLTFMTFEGNRMYVLVFTMAEADTERFWPEISQLLDTVVFH